MQCMDSLEIYFSSECRLKKKKMQALYPHLRVTYSGVCNLVNWLSQTRRNLTIEHLNLNFVTTPKLTPLQSFYAEKVFVSCVWLISVSQLRTRSSLFDTDILQHTVSDLMFSTRSVPVDISNQLKRKNVLPKKMQRKQLKVWELVHSSLQLMLLHTLVVAVKFFRENFF